MYVPGIAMRVRKAYTFKRRKHIDAFTSAGLPVTVSSAPGYANLSMSSSLVVRCLEGGFSF